MFKTVSRRTKNENKSIKGYLNGKWNYRFFIGSMSVSSMNRHTQMLIYKI